MLFNALRVVLGDPVAVDAFRIPVLPSDVTVLTKLAWNCVSSLAFEGPIRGKVPSAPYEEGQPDAPIFPRLEPQA